jgi:hypothetical protein
VLSAAGFEVELDPEGVSSASGQEPAEKFLELRFFEPGSEQRASRGME